MMDKAIQEEIDKGEPLEPRGHLPIAEGEIRPPSLEERIRFRRQQAASEEPRPDLPKDGEPKVPESPAAERPAERDLAAAAKETVVAQRHRQIESAFTALQDRVKTGEAVPDGEKRALLENMLRDAISDMKPALEVGISKIGREVAGAGEPNKYEAGLKHVVDSFMSRNLSTMTYFDNLLKMQPDAKLVREKIQERFVTFLTKEEANPIKASTQRQEQLRPDRPAGGAPKKKSALGDALKPFLEDIKIRAIGWKRQDERRKKTGTDDR